MSQSNDPKKRKGLDPRLVIVVGAVIAILIVGAIILGVGGSAGFVSAAPTNTEVAQPPTSVPPTVVPTRPQPTRILPTRVPATAVPPTTVPPTKGPATSVPPTIASSDTPTSAATMFASEVATLAIPTREGTIEPSNTSSPPSDTPVPTETSLPTLTPNLTASAIANALDAQATQLARTATAPPADITPATSTSGLTLTATITPDLTLVATQSITISDSAGKVIGDGEVRVYAPANMSLGEVAEIQVQIEANPQSNGNATLNPQPSPTPALSTPRATPTPLILVDNGRQFITVYEYMSATLTGVHVGRFDVDAIPPSGVRHLTGSGTVYWWKWSISPKQSAVGVDTLEVYIVPQKSLTDNTPIDSEARTISFQIKVSDAASTPNLLLIVVGALIVIALVVGGGFLIMRGRGTKVPVSPKWGENRVFISYRRDDSLEVVGRIYDRLIEHFGSKTIFKDMDSILPGSDFRGRISEGVGRADVLLAVIGDRWLTITDAEGKRRLDNPQDFVRLEIETALQRNITVIPLLVRNARIPAEADLPASLSQLSYRHGIPIRPDPDFNNDMKRMIKVIETVLTATNTKEL